MRVCVVQIGLTIQQKNSTLTSQPVTPTLPTNTSTHITPLHLYISHHITSYHIKWKLCIIRAISALSCTSTLSHTHSHTHTHIRTHTWKKKSN